MAESAKVFLHIGQLAQSREHLTPLSIVVPRGGVLFAESVHGPGFIMPERMDPFHKLIYILAGEVAYRQADGRKEQRLGVGSVCAISEGTRHSLRDVTPATLLLLCVQEKFLSGTSGLKILGEVLLHEGNFQRQLSRVDRLRVEAIWRWALRETSQSPGTLGREIIIKSLAAQLLVHLARLPAKPHGTSSAESIEAVKQEVDSTFYEEWDLNRAAARAGYSRRRFSELFRRAAGKTFTQYLTETRLRHAAHLLKTQSHSALGVMFACGFNDLSHFHRLFKHRYQSTPRRWSTYPRKTLS